MKSKKLTFHNERGQKLSARLDEPDNQTPITHALFAHCFTCSKDSTPIKNICRALTDHRIGVLRFDFTGLGESEGDFSDTHFSSNVRDLVAAARFLDESSASPGILIGHSLGGTAVLCAAADIPSAKGVVTIGSPSRPEHVLKLLISSLDDIQREGKADVILAGRKFSITREFLEVLDEHNMRRTIRELGRTLLILHSPLDEIVGINNAALIFDEAKHPKSFVSLDHADHLLLDSRDSAYVGTLIAAWISKYLGTD